MRSGSTETNVSTTVAVGGRPTQNVTLIPEAVLVFRAGPEVTAMKVFFTLWILFDSVTKTDFV